MAKFHVNDAGEPGQCSAKIQCPFGGDSKHYDNPEMARMAYELSMAGKELPTITKTALREQVTDEIVEEVAKKSQFANTRNFKSTDKITRENYNPADFGNFAYDEVFLDTEDRLSKLQSMNYPTSLINKEMYRVREEWESEARTRPAQSNENNVPIRLLPTGSTVKIGPGKYDLQYKEVGKPVDNGDGDIVGKYRDSMNAWDYVGPNTTFDTGMVDTEKKLDSRWKAANERASELKEIRRTAAKKKNPNYVENIDKYSYDPYEWDGRKYEDLVWDENEVMYGPGARGRDGRALISHVNNSRITWDNAARTTPAVAGEKKVPARLIPVGSMVRIQRTWSMNPESSDLCEFIAPRVSANGSVYARYLNGDREEVTVDENSTFAVESVPEGKKLSPRWKDTNFKAQALADDRAKMEKAQIEILRKKLMG